MTPTNRKALNKLQDNQKSFVKNVGTFHPSQDDLNERATIDSARVEAPIQNQEEGKSLVPHAPKIPEPSLSPSTNQSHEAKPGLLSSLQSIGKGTFYAIVGTIVTPWYLLKQKTRNRE